MPSEITHRSRVIFLLLYALFWPSFGLLLRLRYRVSLRGFQAIRGLKGPFVVVGNHVSKWDPFILNHGLGRPVYFIASDYLMRKPLLRFILPKVGAIPKTKFKSDVPALKTAIEVVKKGYPLGLYPEGHVNWDGRTLPLVPSTPKLLKVLRVPVVAVRIEGAYFRRPRWSQRFSPGPMVLRFEHLVSAEEIKTIKTSQLSARLEEALAHDSWEYAKKHPHRLLIKDRAKGLAKVLAICPKCHTIGAMASRGDVLGCNHCGYSVELAKDGLLYEDHRPALLNTIGRWCDWQRQYLEQTMGTRPSEAIFQKFDAIVSTGYRSQALSTRTHTGTLLLYWNRMTLVEGEGRASLDIPLAEIEGATIQDSEEMEFYWNAVLYHLSFPSSEASHYLWYMATKIGAELAMEEQ